PKWLLTRSGFVRVAVAGSPAAGRFVAVGLGGRIAVSPDGTSWSSQVDPPMHGFSDVIFANGRFVAVGDNGYVLTSPDGLSWTSRTAGDELFPVALITNPFLAGALPAGVVAFSRRRPLLHSYAGRSTCTW